MNDRHIVLITARLGSSRLVQKHLRDLVPGKTSIQCVIERLQDSGHPLMLCTPEGGEDEPLRQMARTEGIGCFAGDPENVLRRYSQALSYLVAPAAIIVDADDVFVSVEAIRRIPEIYTDQDVIRFSGMAYGGAPYLLSRKFVETMLAAGAAPHGWSDYLDRVPGKKMTVHDFAVSSAEQSYRLSLDYPEDLAFLGYLCEQLGPRTSHANVIQYITANLKTLIARFPSQFDGSVMERARRHLAPSGKEAKP